MANHRRQEDIASHYGTTPPKFERDELLARISDLLKIAKARKDFKSVSELQKLDKTVFVLKSINVKIYNNVIDKLSRISGDYAFNNDDFLDIVNNLQKRAEKIQYNDVLKELEKYRKHIIGEEIIKNKTNSDINLKLENIEKEISVLEEFMLNNEKNNPNNGKSR